MLIGRGRHETGFLVHLQEVRREEAMVEAGMEGGGGGRDERRDIFGKNFFILILHTLVLHFFAESLWFSPPAGGVTPDAHLALKEGRGLIRDGTVDGGGIECRRAFHKTRTLTQ